MAGTCADRRLVPPPHDAASAAADEGGHHHHKHSFTHYVRRVEVVLDPAQYPGDSGRFVWEKSQHEREHREALHVRRLGSAPVEAKLTIELDHQPAQWRLSGALAAALGLRGLHSSPFVMQMLWGYIKAKQLYEVSQQGGREGGWVCAVFLREACKLLLCSVVLPGFQQGGPSPSVANLDVQIQRACSSFPHHLPSHCHHLLSSPTTAARCACAATTSCASCSTWTAWTWPACQRPSSRTSQQRRPSRCSTPSGG